jgi:hypothetical protein
MFGVLKTASSLQAFQGLLVTCIGFLFPKLSISQASKSPHVLSLRSQEVDNEGRSEHRKVQLF